MKFWLTKEVLNHNGGQNSEIALKFPQRLFSPSLEIHSEHGLRIRKKPFEMKIAEVLISVVLNWVNYTRYVSLSYDTLTIFLRILNKFLPYSFKICKILFECI